MDKRSPFRGGLVIPYPKNSRDSYPLSLKLSSLLSPKLLIFGIMTHKWQIYSVELFIETPSVWRIPLKNLDKFCDSPLPYFFAHIFTFRCIYLVFLPPFSLIRDFGKQNTRGFVSKFPSVLRVIDRSDRNPPITATSVTFWPSLRHASGLWLVDFDQTCQ